MRLAAWLFVIPIGHDLIGIFGDYFGTSVSAVGDVDGDGTPDIAVASGSRHDRVPDDPAAYVFSGRTGMRLLSLGAGFEIDGSENGCLAGLGDANEDGHADIALAAWRTPGECSLTVFSGSDGRELWADRFDLPLSSSGYLPKGFVCRSGDADGDGHPELCSGAWSPLRPVMSGRMEIRSGRSGCTIASIADDSETWRWGGPPSEFGDMDEDGVSDVVHSVFVRGGPGDWSNFGFEVRSGRDLRLLRRFEVPDCAQPRCSGIGDVDRDGTPDLLMSGHVPDPRLEYPSFVRILSGRDGGQLCEYRSVPCQFRRTEVADIDDLDADGWRDILFSEFDSFGGCAGIRILSGRDAHELRQFLPGKPGGVGPVDYLGYDVAAAGDIDLDGSPDLVIGSAVPWGDPPGYAEVYSGKHGAVLHRWWRGDVEPTRVRR